MSGNRVPIALAVSIGALLFGAGLYLSGRVFDRPAVVPATSVDIGTRATVLSTAKVLPDFTLVDYRGEPFNATSLKGRWTFLFFGYTHCPDVCPTTLSLLARVEKMLKAEPGLSQPRYVFVSVDPARDTPEHLAEYLPYFSESFVGVTGADDQVLALSRRLGILYQRHPDENGDYLVDHSASVLLIDPGAGLRALHSAPHDANIMADDYRKIVAAFGADHD